MFKRIQWDGIYMYTLYVYIYICGCISAMYTTNNLHSLRSPLIWYYYYDYDYYFWCSPCEMLLYNSIILKYITAHYHSSLTDILCMLDNTFSLLPFAKNQPTNTHTRATSCHFARLAIYAFLALFVFLFIGVYLYRAKEGWDRTFASGYYCS